MTHEEFTQRTCEFVVFAACGGALAAAVSHLPQDERAPTPAPPQGEVSVVVQPATPKLPTTKGGDLLDAVFAAAVVTDYAEACRLAAEGDAKPLLVVVDPSPDKEAILAALAELPPHKPLIPCVLSDPASLAEWPDAPAAYLYRRVTADGAQSDQSVTLDLTRLPQSLLEALR